jgi:hypothetical protein
MSAKNVQVARFQPRHASEAAGEAVPAGATTHLGVIVAIRDAEQVAVAIPGMAGPLTARLAVSLTARRLKEAIASRRSAVILVQGQRPRRAIVIGLIEAVPQESESERSPAPRVIEADVDGKRVRVVGSEEIVFECGKASITLRRNGRVVIRGAYVETDSAGTNRIKGAAVRIN